MLISQVFQSPTNRPFHIIKSKTAFWLFAF